MRVEHHKTSAIVKMQLGDGRWFAVECHSAACRHGGLTELGTRESPSKKAWLHLDTAPPKHIEGT
jgi:hypothetical protein